MRNTFFRLLLIFVLTFVGVQNLMADQGPWKYISWNMDVSNDTSVPSFYYNQLRGYSWSDGYWTYYDNNDGMHVCNDCRTKENYSGWKHQAFFIIAHAPVTAPSYCKIKRSATVDINAKSSFWDASFQIFFFDSEDSAKTTSVNTYEDTRNSLRLFLNSRQGSESWCASASTTVEYFCDNSTGSDSKTTDKYLLFVGLYENGNSTSAKSIQEGGFRHKSYTDTYYYYKNFTFEANEGTGTAMAVQAIENSGNLTANTYTRAGYRFTGWNTAANGSGTAYTDGQAITATASDKGAITLYAQWETVEVPVSAAGYATVFSDKNLVVPAGVEVYGFTYSDGALVQGTQISEGAVLPANKGYLVKATAGTYNFAPTSSAATAYESVLTGTTTEISTPAGDIYVWSKPEGYGYGFYKYTGATIPAGRAYYVK